MPDAHPALSSGTLESAASVDGVAYSPSPMPNSVNPTIAITRDCPTSRNVNVVSTMPVPVVQQPNSIGLRGPIFWSNFSPTRMVPRTPTRYPTVKRPDCSDDTPAPHRTHTDTPQ